MWPKITVVTPSFNQGRFLEQTILSVVGQDYPNLEYFVFDGGSTDDSVEVIRQYEAKITAWKSEADGGQAKAINQAFERSSGEIFCWINSDDFLLPGTLRRVARWLRERIDTPALIYGKALLFRESSEWGKVQIPGFRFGNGQARSTTRCITRSTGTGICALASVELSPLSTTCLPLIASTQTTKRVPEKRIAGLKWLR